MAIESLDKLIVEQLRDLYDAEKRLTRALPKLAKKATDENLQGALKDHLAETESQVERLEQCFKLAGVAARGKACKGMQGIIEEGEEHVGEEYETDSLRDAVIIGAAQKTEHYEIAAYGTLIAHATLCGNTDMVAVLQEILAEEKAADEQLTAIAEGLVNLEAAGEEGEEQGSDGDASDEHSTEARRASTAGGSKSAARSSGRGKGNGSGRSDGAGRFRGDAPTSSSAKSANAGRSNGRVTSSGSVKSNGVQRSSSGARASGSRGQKESGSTRWR